MRGSMMAIFWRGCVTTGIDFFNRYEFEIQFALEVSV